MPPRRRTTVRRRRYQGGSIRDVLNKVNNFLKEHKIISKGAALLSPHLGKFSPIATSIGETAAKYGYGRRRPRRRVYRRRI